MPGNGDCCNRRGAYLHGKRSCMKYLFSFLFCLGAVAGVAQTASLSFKTYSIRYPESWFVEPDAGAKQFTIKAPADTGLSDYFVENLNMVINDVTGYNAQQYAAFSKDYLPQKIKQFVVLENQKGSFAGIDSWYLVFKGMQFGKKLQWKQYYIIKGGKAHILTFTCEARRWKQYLPEVDKMIRSYVVK
jgi:hypothetical protein